MRLPAAAATAWWISLSTVASVGVLGAGPGAHGVAQAGQALLVGLVGGQPGQRDLQQQPRVEQLLERDRAGLEHHRDRVAEAAPHALVGRVGDEDAAAGALTRADQVAAGEQLERLAQRRAADPELGGQVLLAAEEVARPQPLLLDVVLDLDGHLLAGAADHTLPRPRGAHPGALGGHCPDHFAVRSSTTRRALPS
jgi:hypothetical protein